MMSLVRAWCVAFALASVASLAAAQDDAPEDRVTVYRAVEGAQVEDVPGGALLIGAYGVAWLLTLAFVWRLGRIHARNAADVSDLRRQVGSSSEGKD